MEGTVRFSRGMPKNVWLADAQNYINHLSVFQTIGLVDGSFQVRGIVSVADSKFSLNNQKPACYTVDRKKLHP